MNRGCTTPRRTRPPSVVALLSVLVVGCAVELRDGAFACDTAGDCPPTYHCWPDLNDGSGRRCHNTPFDQEICVSPSCEKLLASVPGNNAECGVFYACGSSLNCACIDPTQACNVSGNSPNICECKPNTCGSYNGGPVECGKIPHGCVEGGTIDCGTTECVNGEVCDSSTNRCICLDPEGCLATCDGEECLRSFRCNADETECCNPFNPCLRHQCSQSPSELDDSCGHKVDCGDCSNNETCIKNDIERNVCVPTCGCRAQNYKCGEQSICGQTINCGSCKQVNGPGYACVTNSEGSNCECDTSLYSDTSVSNLLDVCANPGKEPYAKCGASEFEVTWSSIGSGVDPVDWLIIRLPAGSSETTAPASTTITAVRMPVNNNISVFVAQDVCDEPNSDTNPMIPCADSVRFDNQWWCRFSQLTAGSQRTFQTPECESAPPVLRIGVAIYNPDAVDFCAPYTVQISGSL